MIGELLNGVSKVEQERIWHHRSMDYIIY
jgi:hypothetical protein